MRRPLVLLAGIAALCLGLWWVGPRARPLSSLRLSLSPQECVTECQSRQTDCVQDCEGRLSCEQACVRSGEACVARCRQPADAGAAPSPVPPPR